jgi:hypothetical protein
MTTRKNVKFKEKKVGVIKMMTKEEYEDEHEKMRVTSNVKSKL